MRIRAPLLAAILALIAAMAAALAAPPATTVDRALLTALRARLDRSGAHLALDFSAGAHPLWQVYTSPDQGAVIIDVRGVDASGARLPERVRDPLVTQWEWLCPTFRSAQWIVRLGYAVPASCIRAHLTAGTLTVDIDRTYNEAQTLAVTRNLTWRRQESRDSDDYELINELEIAPAADVKIGVAHAGDSLTTVEDPVAMARRKGALALINGGFFQMRGGPLGLVIDEGRVLVAHVSRRPPRTAVGFTAGGEVIMNRVEVKDGRPRAIDGNTDWSRAIHALGGGPRLVRDGRVALTTEEEALGKRGNDITRKAGRTAVGVLRNGRVVFVTLSGYSDNHAQGWPLPRLAAWFIERGATDAMCLDGGGSVAMVLDGVLVSRPPASSGWQRKVANGLMVTDRTPSLLPTSVRVTAAAHRVAADGTTPVKIVAEVTDAAGRPVADGTVVYFTTTRGIVTARARTVKGRASATFLPLRAPGVATVFGWAGLVSGQDDITLMAGAPRRLAARALRSSPAMPPPSPPSGAEGPTPLPTAIPPPTGTVTLEVLVLDAHENALPNQEASVAGGPAGSVVTVRTGPDGVGRITLAGELSSPLLRVTCGTLPPVDVAVP